MQRITPTEIKNLAKTKGQPSVSIYMPTNGADFADNRTSLKRLLSVARSELTGVTSYKEKHEALYPAYRLLHDREWWRFVDQGVAIFSNSKEVKAYQLSTAPKREIVVSDRFHILPLVDHLNQQGSFYVLALSPKNTRLLHCDGEDMYELSVPNMPRSIEDVIVRDNAMSKPGEKQSQKPRLRNALMALREGGRRAIKRQHQDVLESEYLKQIHNAIKGALASHHEPVVLAGLQRNQSLYRRVDNSNYIHPEGIRANVDRLSNLELRDRARDLLGSLFTQKELAAQSQFLRLSVARPDKVVYGLKNVLRSVYQGRVQTLFVDRDAHQWGLIKRSLVQLHTRRRGGDSDLLDVAASETVKRSGKVFSLESSDLPQGTKVAAVLRY